MKFILPVEHADENLWSPIRATWLRRFHADGIVWHMGDEPAFGARDAAGPSPHLLDSQVACLNIWGGLESQPDRLAAVLRAIVPDVARVVAPVAEGRLVEAEWIGLANHLGEKGARKRGAHATSADLLLAFEDARGRRHGVLVESKYTESYVDAPNRARSAKGTDRATLYRPAFDGPTSPMRHDADLPALLVEPFDQLLRQQLLAAAMEDARELGFETVRVLHAAPRANRTFHETVPDALRAHGATVMDAWRALLRRPERFMSIAYEDLFAFARDAGADAGWLAWMGTRYGFAA